MFRQSALPSALIDYSKQSRSLGFRRQRRLLSKRSCLPSINQPCQPAVGCRQSPARRYSDRTLLWKRAFAQSARSARQVIARSHTWSSSVTTKPRGASFNSRIWRPESNRNFPKSSFHLFSRVRSDVSLLGAAKQKTHFNPLWSVRHRGFFII